MIRQVAFKGSHKISDKWVKDPYVVVDIPIAGIPVFKVQKESDSSVVKTLHRNLLLPFSAIPRISQVDYCLSRQIVQPRLKPGKATSKPVIQISESEHNSDSEQAEVSVQRYVPPHRRRPSGAPIRSRITNVSRDSTTSRSQGHFEDSNISNITHNSSGPSFQSVPSSDVQSSRSISTSNSTHDFGPSIAPMAPPEPRRSGRNRQVPQRFGGWVYQQSVDNADVVEYFVWFYDMMCFIF